MNAQGPDRSTVARVIFPRYSPEWRNGRRRGLKIPRGQPRVSSTLTSGMPRERYGVGAVTMLKVVLVAAVAPEELAASLKPVPARSTLRSPKLATPSTAATVLVPLRNPPVGFVPRATVMVPVRVVTVLPAVSRAVPSFVGVIICPAVPLLGCGVRARPGGVPDVRVLMRVSPEPVPPIQ